jgi:hypothetical protein
MGVGVKQNYKRVGEKMEGSSDGDDQLAKKAGKEMVERQMKRWHVSRASWHWNSKKAKPKRSTSDAQTM